MRGVQTLILALSLASCAAVHPVVATPINRIAPAPHRGEQVIAVGSADELAMVDADTDRIADTDDRCIDQPETYNGFLDDDGCPDRIPEGNCHCFSPPEIFFARPTDVRLDSTAIGELKSVASLLRAIPGPVRLRGHASLDEAATEPERVVLGEKRAIAVREFLVRLGLDRWRFIVESHGASDLRDCTKDIDVRQRRVEVFFELPSDPSVVPAVPVTP